MLKKKRPVNVDPKRCIKEAVNTRGCGHFQGLTRRLPLRNDYMQKRNLIRLASGSIIEVATSEIRNTNEDRTCVLCLTGVYQTCCNLGQ